MSVNNTVTAHLAMANRTLTSVAEDLSLKHNKNVSVQSLSNKLNNNTMRYNEVLEIASIIGYEIKWVKKETDD